VPTRKQRRRRQKERRHEYEYVYVDEQGEEVDVDPEELEEAPAARAPSARSKPKTAPKQERSASFRGGREVQPPSWRRVGKRGLIFAPFMFLTLLLLDQGRSYDLLVINTVVLLAFFLPFSYVLDTLMYRVYVKRTGGQAAGGASRRR
jgi:hypothetical protein